LQQTLLVKLVSWKNVNNASTTTLAELYAARSKSEQCVVFTDANVVARMHLSAALTNENCSSSDDGSVKHLYAESLRV
jgi:hypothetical protein